MNLKEIKDLVDLITEKEITEFELERSGVRLRIKRKVNSLPQVSLQPADPALPEPVYRPASMVHSPAVASALPEPALVPPASAPAEALAEDLHLVKSPIVRTFYEAPAPDTPPFVTLGDSVEIGQVLCIVEAMKLMNEIESDAAGQVSKCYVENAQPVEYGEALFAIRPAAKKT